MIKTIVSKIDIKQDQGTKILKVLGYPLYIYALSDGTCQVGAKAAALLGLNDTECKFEVAREENAYLLNYFDLYKESFSYPHSIKIGLKENMTFKDELEFKTFLALNPKAPFMWGDEMQLQVTSNMHSMNINVLTISPAGEGTVRTILPDSRLNINSENKELYQEIWLMLKAEHYTTLVKKDNPLVSQDECESKTINPSQSVGDKQVDYESEKDKIIRKLKSDLREEEKKGLKSLETMYIDCEKVIKNL